MIYFKKVLIKALITVLIHLIFCLHFSPLICAEQGNFLSHPAMNTSITEHPPQMLTPPELKIPVEEIAKKPRKTWLWVIGGVLVVGAIAAAGGGGGEGGGDGVDDTGEVTVEW